MKIYPILMRFGAIPGLTYIKISLAYVKTVISVVYLSN